MSQISVSGLTFGYEGALENVFTNVSFSFDTDWKLGLIGRNGKGKTTFLKLLLGEYEYRGAISSSAHMEYFPYKIPEEWMGLPGTEICQRLSAETEDWQILKELSQLDADGELLYIPKATPKEGWGTASGSRSYYQERNQEIREQHRRGASVSALARQYHLSVSTIKKIIYC